MAHQQCRQFGLAEAHADAVAGNPWLRYLELGVADPVTVADTDLAVGQAIDSEVLTELAVAEVVPAEVPRPVPVGLNLIDENGALSPP